MRRRWFLLAEVILIVAIGVYLGVTLGDSTPHPAGSIDLKVQLRGAHDKAYLYRDKVGEYRYQITLDNDRTENLSPDQFAGRIYQQQNSRSWWQVVLNITSPWGVIWVGVGLLGQVLFTGRMVVQWLVSEKEKRSVVPTSFWWMSLGGASMLLAYFLWRKDPIGVLGQGLGWFIYIRNLWLIYTAQDASLTSGDDPGPEPELAKS